MRFREWTGHRRLRAFRAPIYIHWSVFAIAAVLAIGSMRKPAHAVVAILSYFAIILIHECGHAWVARRRHYRVNCIRIAGYHGRCEIEAPEYEWDDVAIAWGGVLAQFAVAIPMIVIQLSMPARMHGAVGFGAMMLGQISVVIALFNLIPAAGLDGAKAWRVIPLARDWWQSRRTTKRLLRKWTRR